MENRYSLEGLKIDDTHDRYTFTAFYEAAKRYPDRPAIIFLGTTFTFRRLRDMIDRFANALSNLGIGHQDRVMLYLANSPQWVIANFAIQRIGAVVVPVSPIYTAHELEYMIGDANVETVICQDTNYGYVHEVDRKIGLKRIITTTVTELLPAWKVVLGRMLDKIPSGKVAKSPKIYRFGKLLKESNPHPPQVHIDPWRDLSHIMYTGGTTGFPKGVPGNHATETSYLEDVVDDILKPHIKEGSDTILMVNPLYHIMAKGFMIAAGLNLGNTIILMPQPHVDAMLREIERHKIRWMLGVPTLYRMVLENDRLSQYDVSSIRYSYCGGDVLPGEVFNRWKALTGHPIYQVYGATEVGHVAYSPIDREPQPTVAGVPLKTYRYKIYDTEKMCESVQGEVGELLVTAGCIIKSYWNKPEESASSYIQIGDETYYRTGDFMAVDQSGEFRFMERTADVIKYKGYRISASEIEAALQDHPTVVGACAVGIPDDAVGERIKAIVVLKSDARGISGNELRAWLKERLASYKVPHYIEFRDMLPKSKVGKLLRREIRNEELRKMGKKK